MGRIAYVITLVVSVISSRALVYQQTPSTNEADTRAPRPLQHMLVINEDNSHFFGSRQLAEMTREGLNAFVDQYADSAVTHLFLCPNAMRTSFHSKSRDAIWDAVKARVNRLEIRQTSGAETQQIVWVEIDLQPSSQR